MRDYETGIDTSLEVVCGKWKGLILWELLHTHKLRFNELRRAINGNISSRILSRELSKLIEDGLVERIDYQKVPPKVEYRLTPYGKTTTPFLKAMNKWGLEHKKYQLSRQEMAELVNDEQG
ncbi:helix-turn-helix transcriptional regulator [Halobacillus salinarum]|uniref:Helix-turn-helix transcriptional regulator n=1 Tax=Halobacillus salinarum TaxID=2932257 RepID=A0ABY4EKX4_9BACI|nr:helix-turn-helix domain-containing protein [Halobacillus salinarum]UOQ45115.1 helix-turn-helix transcriptional regulator [Halobacillus salinarum]